MLTCQVHKSDHGINCLLHLIIIATNPGSCQPGAAPLPACSMAQYIPAWSTQVHTCLSSLAMLAHPTGELGQCTLLTFLRPCIAFEVDTAIR